MPPLSESLQTWTRDEVLEFAYSRGTRLRRRRLVVRSAAAVAGVVAMALPIAMVLTDNAGAPDRNRVKVVDTPPTTAPEQSAPDPQAGALGPAPASGAAPSSQGVGSARKAAAPVIKEPEAPTTTLLPELAACGVRDVELVTATDKAKYMPTDVVRVTARFRNISARRCLPPTRASLAVTGPDGRPAHSDEKPAPPAEELAPGVTVELVFEWRPEFGMQGEHTAAVTWRAGRQFGPSQTTFTVSVA